MYIWLCGLIFMVTREKCPASGMHTAIKEILLLISGETIIFQLYHIHNFYIECCVALKSAPLNMCLHRNRTQQAANASGAQEFRQPRSRRAGPDNSSLKNAFHILYSCCCVHLKRCKQIIDALSVRDWYINGNGLIVWKIRCHLIKRQTRRRRLDFSRLQKIKMRGCSDFLTFGGQKEVLDVLDNPFDLQIRLLEFAFMFVEVLPKIRTVTQALCEFQRRQHDAHPGRVRNAIDC